MEDNIFGCKEVPLSVDEESAWLLLVEEGRRIREPILEKRRMKLEERERAYKERHGGKGLRERFWESKADSMVEIPASSKRWVILRFAGTSFNKAGILSRTTWVKVQEAKAHSEEFRCALAAQEANSRRLMKAKALSIMEQSQDEGAKVSLPQAQLAMKILSSLDREHFGEDRGVAEEVDGIRRVGGGGFVINVIGDAAAIASKPKETKSKALVYDNV